MYSFTFEDADGDYSDADEVQSAFENSALDFTDHVDVDAPDDSTIESVEVTGFFPGR